MLRNSQNFPSQLIKCKQKNPFICIISQQNQKKKQSLTVQNAIKYSVLVQAANCSTLYGSAFFFLINQNATKKIWWLNGIFLSQKCFGMILLCYHKERRRSYFHYFCVSLWGVTERLVPVSGCEGLILMTSLLYRQDNYSNKYIEYFTHSQPPKEHSFSGSTTLDVCLLLWLKA